MTSCSDCGTKEKLRGENVQHTIFHKKSYTLLFSSNHMGVMRSLLNMR